VAGGAFFSEKGSGSNCLIIIAVCLFGIGLLAAVIRVAMDYYCCDAVARSIGDDVSKLYTDQIEVDQFLAARKKAKIAQWPFHGLGFTSGICFFVGLLIGIIGSLK
jgi:hypothetical protein